MQGALSDLCDKIFHDMIVQDDPETERGVSLKDLIIARRREQERKADELVTAKAAADARAKMSLVDRIAARKAEEERKASLFRTSKPLSATPAVSTRTNQPKDSSDL